MKLKLLGGISIASTLLCGPILTHAAIANPQWGYKGSVLPPSKWATQYSQCQPGGLQTPININTHEVTKIASSHITFNFNAPATDIINNGHSIQINFPNNGDDVTINNKLYHLLQFHFHSPSENTINGMHYPIEMHFVLQGKKQQLVVVGEFFKIGQANPALTALWQHLPGAKGQSISMRNMNVDYVALESATPYYQFTGSLTTPPCTPGVKWYVATNPMTMSQKQLSVFNTLYKRDNRPLQHMNGRIIKVG